MHHGVCCEWQWLQIISRIPIKVRLTWLTAICVPQVLEKLFIDCLMHIINSNRKDELLSFSFYWRLFNLRNTHITSIHGNAPVYAFSKLISTLKTTALSPVSRNVSVIYSHSARGCSSGVHSGQRLWGEDHPEVERTSADLRDHHSVRGTGILITLLSSQHTYFQYSAVFLPPPLCGLCAVSLSPFFFHSCDGWQRAALPEKMLRLIFFIMWITLFSWA